MGGYIAGRQHLKDFLIQRCRPLLFSTSQPPAVAAACIAAIDVLEQEPERIQRLWDNTRLFKSALQGLGFDTGISETPITPVIAGDEAKAQQLAARLFEEGVFATSVVFPTVALGKARVRTIVTSEHSRDDLQTCINAFEKVGRELRLI
jgi:glycine C-acetyltransferase